MSDLREKVAYRIDKYVQGASRTETLDAIAALVEAAAGEQLRIERQRNEELQAQKDARRGCKAIGELTAKRTEDRMVVEVLLYMLLSQQPPAIGTISSCVHSASAHRGWDNGWDDKARGELAEKLARELLP